MLAKATIINKTTNEPVVCMFNPKEYTFSKQNNWSEKPSQNKSVAHMTFGGGQPASLTIKLLFDTYEDHPPLSKAGEDVRSYTKGLWDMMKIVKGSQPEEPPHCIFKWGALWSFEAVIDSISQTFTLFDANGVPLRATLDVSFKQVHDEGQYPRQNPTSGGEAGERLHIVRVGETLADIAYEVYGDPMLWRHLAHVNRVDDPRRLWPGQTLRVAPLF